MFTNVIWEIFLTCLFVHAILESRIVMPLSRLSDRKGLSSTMKEWWLRMKHLIRAICVLLLQAMLLSFTACGSNTPDGAESRKGASSETGETDTESADTTPENEYPAAPARGKDEQINWYSADLAETMRLAAGYVEGMLDADKDYEPYFYISAAGYGQPAVALHALEIGIPHVTGRAIDCLFNVERATGRKIDSFSENTYTEYYYSCMEEIGLPVWYDETGSRKGMTPHNLREERRIICPHGAGGG